VAAGPPLLRGVAQSACGGAGSPPPKAQAAGCELHIDTDIIHECGPGPLGPGPGPLRASPDPTGRAATIADWTSRFAEMVRDSRTK
jgi:hypothetical protein